MEQRKCFSLQCLSPSLLWSTLRTRKNSIAKETHLALGVSCFVPAPRAWRQLRNLIKINGEKELNKSQHEYLWKSILQRSGMEVKKDALCSLSFGEGGRLNLSQSALDLSLSVDLSHSLSLSLSLPPSLLSPSRKRRKRMTWLVLTPWWFLKSSFIWLGFLPHPSDPGWCSSPLLSPVGTALFFPESRAHLLHCVVSTLGHLHCGLVWT